MKTPFAKKLVKKIVLFLILAVLPVSFTFPQESALVLSGGGGKGAYEVGVWQALLEYGIAQKISVIAGSSVGGLNAALFAVSDMDDILAIWRNLVPQFLVEEDAIISQNGLRKIIESLPLEKLHGSYPFVNVTCVRRRFSVLKTVAKTFGLISAGDVAHRFWLNAEDDVSEIRQLLLATSAFPFVTEPVELKDGYKYTDGGNELVGGDNVPIDAIIEDSDNGFYGQVDRIDTIYVVYLAQVPKRRIKVKDYDKFRIVEIIPSIDLAGLIDGTCNFTADRINLLINIGYEDTVRILRDKGLYPVSDFWF
ncbi:MAG: patatin-like phospholipase family protein [Treponemataceae bacterium]|nr:patatin-like phospholipase family protein [Treponemataceae bacterium]